MFKARAASEEALGWTAAALEDYKRYAGLQLAAGSMRLEQGLLLEYESKIQRREWDNRRLRARKRWASKQEVAVLERVRRWQTAALALGALLVALLASLAWRQRASRAAMHAGDGIPSPGRPAGWGSRTGSRALAQAHAEEKPLSLLMLDLDHFKTVSDRYGHAAGDAVLRAAVDAREAQLRGRDPLGRVGGEEFVVVCPETSLAQATVVAHRLLEATRGLRFRRSIPAAGHRQHRHRPMPARRGPRQPARPRRCGALPAKQRGRDRAEA